MYRIFTHTFVRQFWSVEKEGYEKVKTDTKEQCDIETYLLIYSYNLIKI